MNSILRSLTITLRNWNEPVTKQKKQFDEQLQEIRSKNHNKLPYRKRVQQEQEADEELKEYENRKSERRTD